jgi:hypothetical protein
MKNPHVQVWLCAAALAWVGWTVGPMLPRTDRDIIERCYRGLVDRPDLAAQMVLDMGPATTLRVLRSCQ